MKASIFKIFCWIGLLLIIVVLVPAQQADTEVCIGRGADFISGLKDSSHTIFFIGSSRTKCSVNDELITRELNNRWKVINLGIASSSISQHYFLAEHIAKQKGKKIFFVELSGFRREHSSNVAVSHYLLKVPGGTGGYYHSVDSIAGKESVVLPSFTSIQRTVFNAFKIAQVALKSFVGVHPGCKDHFGYKTLAQLRRSGSGPLLRPGHFQQYAGTKTDRHLEQYIKAFRSLEHRSQDLTIIFVLPFTSYREKERESMIPTYVHLEESEKVVYPSSLYHQLSDSTVLADNNHLNKKGAEIYTSFFQDYLKKYLEHFTEEQKLH